MKMTDAMKQVVTFRAIVPGKVTLYSGLIRISYPNLVAVVPPQSR
jgi:hypothetical protein